MMFYHFKDKKEFYERIANGSLQESMMKYFQRRAADMDFPIEEDTLLYNFEAEFEVELENGKRCITDDDVAHKQGELAAIFHDVIVAVWNEYQDRKSSQINYDITIIHQDTEILTWKPIESIKIEYIFVDYLLFIRSDFGNTLFTFAWKPGWNIDWTKITESYFAEHITDGLVRSTLWKWDAAKDDIIEHYRQNYQKIDKEGSISSVEEYELYLRHAEESSSQQEFLQRIDLDENLPCQSESEEKWLRTQCGLRPNPLISLYLKGLRLACKQNIYVNEVL